MTRRFGRYLLWQLPGWVMVAFVAWAAMDALALPAWIAVLGPSLFVLKDLVLYPAMRAVFRPAASPDLIGALGETIEPIAPIGYVRVHGELWRATTPDRQPLPAGAAVRVVAGHGLTLVVRSDDRG